MKNFEATLNKILANRFGTQEPEDILQEGIHEFGGELVKTTPNSRWYTFPNTKAVNDFLDWKLNQENLQSVTIGRHPESYYTIFIKN